MRRLKTDQLDGTGRTICDGDLIRGIIFGEIIVGVVLRDDDGSWYVSCNSGYTVDLNRLDDVEILSRGEHYVD